MSTDLPPGAAAPVEFRDDVTVDLIKHSASDSDVLWAARVSTAGEQSLEELTKDPERSKGLLNYLMRDRHGSPFEHNSMTFFISAPIFVFREFMRHRVGWCLAGDTEVTLESGAGRLSREPIKDLYQRWHGSARDRRSVGHVRCYDEDTLRARRTSIVDVMESGAKPLLRITTGSGRVLRCSVDHAILTPDGWRKAGELAAGDAVMAAAGTPPGREPDQHDGESAGPDRITAVADDGEEMTYDLAVDGPWHNFVANGIVVHNSYNEESGRYRELQPVFYVPGAERKLVQQGRPGKYEFVHGIGGPAQGRCRRDGGVVRPVVRRLPGDAGGRGGAGGGQGHLARGALLVDVRHLQRTLADALPRAAHPARAGPRAVLPAAGDRDGRGADGGGLGGADAAHPRGIQRERPSRPLRKCPKCSDCRHSRSSSRLQKRTPALLEPPSRQRRSPH